MLYPIHCAKLTKFLQIGLNTIVYILKVLLGVYFKVHHEKSDFIIVSCFFHINQAPTLKQLAYI